MVTMSCISAGPLERTHLPSAAGAGEFPDVGKFPRLIDDLVLAAPEISKQETNSSAVAHLGHLMILKQSTHVVFTPSTENSFFVLLL